MSEELGQKVGTYASVVAGICLLAIAVSHLLQLSSTGSDFVLGAGVVLAGTVAWVVQARQKCPRCGAPYGMRFRFVRANLCPKCGHDLRAG